MTEKDEFLEKEFDFSKAVKNPYAKALKKQVTINLDENVIIYFKEKADQTGIPYQTLINLYLRDCVTNNRNLELTWK
jgi:predicted DNA binding CopG/RHH family protein